MQVLTWVVLICLGMLLGSTWTIQAVQPKLRRQAEKRRVLNEEWSAVRNFRQQRDKCPRCGTPQSLYWDWYYPPTMVKDPPDDD